MDEIVGLFLLQCNSLRSSFFMKYRALGPLNSFFKEHINNCLKLGDYFNIINYIDLYGVIIFGV